MVTSPLCQSSGACWPTGLLACCTELLPPSPVTHFPSLGQILLFVRFSWRSDWGRTQVAVRLVTRWALSSPSARDHCGHAGTVILHSAPWHFGAQCTLCDLLTQLMSPYLHPSGEVPGKIGMSSPQFPGLCEGGSNQHKMAASDKQ